MVNNIPMDNVHLNFTVEDWLSSNSAEVTVNINASTNGETGNDLKEEVRKALTDLVKVDWRFVSVSRTVSRSGMEEWLITAQARVNENSMSNINARAKKLGRQGLQYRVGLVDYTPTKEQFEELFTGLREKIYGMVSNEIIRLNTELEGRVWRVAAINFDGRPGNFQLLGAGNVRAQSMANIATASAGYNDDFDDDDGVTTSEGFSGFEVSQKVEMSAQVVLSTTVAGFDNLDV